MADLMGFDASKIQPNEPSTPVPKGDYQVIILESEKKPTSKGDGYLLNMVLQVVEGPFKGKKLYDRLNIWNKSEDAVKIAKGTLSAICRAVNVLQPRDSEDLHNRTMTAVVDVKDYEGKLRNEVKGYKPKQTAVAVTATVSPDGFAGQSSKPNPFA